METEISRRIKQKEKETLIDTDNNIVITRGNRDWGEEEEGKGG